MKLYYLLISFVFTPFIAYGQIWSIEYIEDCKPLLVASYESIDTLIATNPDSGLILAKKNYEQIKNVNIQDACRAKIALQLGKAYNFINMALSVKYLQEANKYLEKEGFYTDLVNSYNLIGGAYFNTGEFNETIKYTELALKIADQFKVKGKQSILFNNLAGAYRKLKQYKKALELVDKAISLADSESNKTNLMLAYSTKGELYLDQNQYDNALFYFQKSYQIGEGYNLHTDYSLGFCLTGIASSKFHLGDTLKAIELAKESLQHTEHISYIHIKKEAIELLADIWHAKNQIDSAYYYLRYARNLEDQIHAAEKVRQMNRLAIQQHEEQIEAQIAQNKQQRLLTYASLIIGTFLLVVLVILIFSYRKIKNLYKKVKIQTKTIEENNKLLAKQRDQLSNLNRVKDKIFSAVMHDFKTPINSLESMLNLLIKKHMTPEEAAKIAQQLKISLLQSKTSIDNIITWVKSQLDGLKIKLTDIQLDSFLDSIKSYHASAARDKGIKLQVSYDQPFTFQSDKDILFIIINNLVTNALKFTHKGGEVTIDVHHEDRYITFKVTDNGIGIPEDIYEKLFSIAYYSQTGTSNEKGTGLGLIISKELIKKLNGKIEVTSKINEGATFTVTLPITPANE